MRAWLARCQPGAALWVELELAPTGAEGLPFAITAHVRGPRRVQDHVLARCEPHPRVLHVDEGAVAALRADLRAG